MTYNFNIYRNDKFFAGFYHNISNVISLYTFVDITITGLRLGSKNVISEKLDILKIYQQLC